MSTPRAKKVAVIGVAGLLVIAGAIVAVAVLLPRAHRPLAYMIGLTPTTKTVAVLDLEGSARCQPPQLVGASDSWMEWARWTPRRDRIVYLAKALESKASSVWAMAPDGSQRQRLIPTLPDNLREQSVRFSPSGRYAAMLTQRVPDSGPWDTGTYVFDTLTATSRRIMTATLAPAWSPVQDELAVYRWGDGTINVMRPDGSILKAYSAEFPEGDLAWSPDGKQVAFFSSSLPDGGFSPSTDVYSVVLENGRISKLTRSTNQYVNRLIYDLAWSPDGKRIAFSASYMRQNGEGNAGGLFVMDVETGQEVHLADDLGWSSPVWSPDGKEVGFVSTRDEPKRQGYGQIYTVDVASAKITQVTCFDGLKQSLSW